MPKREQVSAASEPLRVACWLEDGDAEARQEEDGYGEEEFWDPWTQEYAD